MLLRWPRTSSESSDKLALIQFKNAVTQDPLGALKSWNTSLHYCDWTGVTCDHARQRVKVLDLRSNALVGYSSPYITNLSEVIEIHLQNNMEINLLEGSLQSLRHGIIPASLFNLSSLVFLKLALNNLEGRIPGDIGKATRLSFINIYGNLISGTLPSSLFNLTSLYYLAMADNKFHGILPSDMGVTLPNLQVLGGGLNSFTGSIPASLSNASGLTVVDFADCALSGSIP
ncbi:putative receptor-like protein kinase At3g47110 [Dioscorea cayenensis subsp. rotundata]|uniref:Receptor-like protein kinase At3g47110 n=1 Tax=Dioscorea cayennensis subsp. rotundata TaxID=55577 RepID=A0AB40D0F8_DIOCR|nr:putative receptor-like protein kinase At3g47110 [Dioscorea cayenensis subsp. rotundata]